MSRFSDVVERLTKVIESRRGGDQKTSWTARLIADRALAGKKLAEEALEAALAAVQQDNAALTRESGDLIYHWLALLAGAGVSLDEVAKVLEEREGRSGVDEKAARTPAP